MRAGTGGRYTREWLERQAATGVLDVTDTADPSARSFKIPEGHDIALTDPDSMLCVEPLARQLLGMLTVSPRPPEAFRSGAGIPFDTYGAAMREGMGEVNRVSPLPEATRMLMPNALTSMWRRSRRRG